MDLKILNVCFGGELKMINGGCDYVGDCVSKPFMIQNHVEVDLLKQMISDRFDICLETHEIKMTHLHPFQKLKVPFTINKNEDLKAFMDINEAPQVSWSLPLHVLARKRTNRIEIDPIDQQNSAFTTSSVQCFEASNGDDTQIVALEETEGYNDVDQNEDGSNQDEDEGLGVALEETEGYNDGDQNEDGSDHDEDGPDFFTVGQIFKSKTELKSAVSDIAVKQNFEFRIKKSNTTKFKAICRYHSCNWTIVATSVKNSRYFEIRKINQLHSCSFSFSCVEHQPSYQNVAEKFKTRYEGVTKGPNPTDIRNSMQKEFKKNVSYWKAWKAKGLAQDLVRGTPEENFTMFPSYFYMMQQVNPGTYHCIETDESTRFKYAFLSFGASIRGFKFLRKVIMVDATFLHGKFRGVLISATAQDGDKHVYPLAFAVVDSENDSSWKWFFQRLLHVIPSTSDLVFVSDRHLSISKAIEAVYSSAKHVICTCHLKQDVKGKFKDRGVINFVTKASECYTVREFEDYFNGICDINKDIGKYLQDAVFEKWSRAHFQGDRYNIMTTNNAECINAILEDARSYPIIALFDHIREKLSSWFSDRREKAEKCNDLPPTVEEDLRKRYNQSGKYDVKELNPSEYHVAGGKFSGIVNLGKKTCSCRMFDLDHMPCVHAVAVINRLKINITDFVSEYYKIQSWYMAYQETIYPVPSKSTWVVPEDVLTIVCHCP